MDTLNKILSLLEKQNKSQTELARYLDLKSPAITKWVSGKNISYLKYIDKIAEFLGVSADYLLGIEQKENSPQLSELSKRIIDELESLSKTEAEAVLKQIELIKSLRLK